MRYNVEMFYIVGLGNPGEKYEKTRHNVGWLALDNLIDKIGLPSLIESKAVSGRTTDGFLDEQKVTVLYPDTFMNNSGSAVVKLVSSKDIDKLVVVHDDIDLPFGIVKVVKGRGAGGNNGVKSIINKLGSNEFTRVKIGIAPTSFWSGKIKRPAGGGALERFVLKPFSTTERNKLSEVFDKVEVAVAAVVTVGPEEAMNRCNKA